MQICFIAPSINFYKIVMALLPVTLLHYEYIFPLELKLEGLNLTVNLSISAERLHCCP